MDSQGEGAGAADVEKEGIPGVEEATVNAEEVLGDEEATVGAGNASYGCAVIREVRGSVEQPGYRPLRIRGAPMRPSRELIPH